MEGQLTVAEAHPRDYGKGIARIDQDKMHSIGIESGVFILIRKIGASHSATAKVLPSYPNQEEDKVVIWIDPLTRTRRNTQTKLGDLVNVRKANISKARKIVMKTTALEYSSLDPRYFTDALESIAVKVGDKVWVRTSTRDSNSKLPKQLQTKK